MAEDHGTYEWGHQWGRVEYGVGCRGSLPAELERLRVERPFLISTPSLAESTYLDQVRELVQAIGEFTGCVAHVPEAVAAAAGAAVEAAGADGIVAVGGSSVVDTAKAANVVRLAGSSSSTVFGDVREGRLEFSADPGLPMVAIPTTLSGAEYTSLLGTTDPEGVKLQLSDPRLAIRSVLLDPDATVSTPSKLWVGTGVKTMSDAIEQLSFGGNVATDALCARSISLFMRSLAATPDKPLARMACLQASWMSLFALQDAAGAIGLSAALRHQVAVTFEAGHADVTCVLLPHVMRFNAPALGERGTVLASALGVEPAAGGDSLGRAADRVEELIGDLGVPTRLGEISARCADLESLAERVLEERAAQLNPRPATVADIVTMLRAAW